MKNQGDGKGIIGEERGKKLLFNFVDFTCLPGRHEQFLLKIASIPHFSLQHFILSGKKHSFLFSSVRMCLIVKLNHFFRTDVSVSLGCGDA